MKTLIILLLTSALIPLYAEFVMNPDSNTLWYEDGKNIATGPNGDCWNNKSVEVSMLPEGGFKVSGTKNRPTPSTTRKVPLSNEYPWLIFRLKKTLTNPGTYHAWSLRLGDRSFFQATVPISGTYMMNWRENSKQEKQAVLDIYARNMEAQFEYIKLLKQPDNILESKLTNGEFQVFVKLKEQAEDVFVRIYYQRYALTSKLQLKPTDEFQKNWCGTFILKESLSYKGQTTFSAGALAVCAVVLGGNIDEPLFATINSSFP